MTFEQERLITRDPLDILIEEEDMRVKRCVMAVLCKMGGLPMGVLTIPKRKWFKLN